MSSTPIIDPSLEPPEEPEVLISGQSATGADGGLPHLYLTRVYRDTISIAATVSRGFGGETWVVEIIPSEDGARARVCRVLSTDGHPLGCVDYEDAGALCADAPEITLSALPTTQAELDAIAVRVSARLSDGTTLDLDL